MAAIQQFGVDVMPVEDRLVLKLNAAGQPTMRFWVTRRFLALFWKALTGEMRKSVADARSPAARDFLLDMAETRLMAKADFATAFKERAAAPASPAPAAAASPAQAPQPAAPPLDPPRLLWGFNIQRKADGHTAIVLIAIDNARIDITLADDGVFGLMRILREAADKAEWELPLAWGAGLPGAEAAKPPPPGPDAKRRLN
ncbi:MAG: hypothetical protein ACKO1J_11890 [Tagaea sp.]